MNSSCTPASCPEKCSSIGNVTTSEQSMNCTPDIVTVRLTQTQSPVYSTVVIVSTVTTYLPCSKLNKITPIASCPLPSTSTVYTTGVVTPSHTQSVETTPSHTVDDITSHTEGSTTECSNQANGTSIALGFVVGLLTLLLTAVIIASVAIIYIIQSKRVTKANRVM